MIEREGHSSAQHAPPISALFLVVFDQKIGYSIAYKRAIANVHLEGVVEYKSLPSGLHNVQSDLVYFVHDQHAGISAFVSRPAAEADRNAHFVAVGALVPLHYGRLGRSWLHAAALRELADTTVENISDTTALDQYWESHCIHQGKEEGHDESSEAGSSKQSDQPSRKQRAPSDAAALDRGGHALSSDHPAMSLPQHLDCFGPLIFPLYRTALLRKRILVLTQAPVLQACDLVYNISVMSNIPSHLAEMLPESNAPIMQPLFNVGVHDIDFLTKISRDDSGVESGNQNSTRPGSYIACSTDEILATKHDVYDILVDFPQELGPNKGVKQWPVLRKSGGEQIKATQRDLRRYRALKKELHRFERSTQPPYHDDDDQTEGNDESETAKLLSAARSIWEDEEEDTSTDDESQLVEATTWTAMAYSGFLWWASAGEKETWLEDESAQDTSLLTELPLPDIAHTMSNQSSRSGVHGNGSGKRASNGKGISTTAAGDDMSSDVQAKAMLILAFMQRLTTMIMDSSVDIVEVVDDEDEGEDGAKVIPLDSEGLRRMGLDVWSAADKEFAQELLQLYFQTEVEVRGQGVECCGMKIC